MTSPDLSSVSLPPLPDIGLGPQSASFIRDWNQKCIDLAVAEATKVPPSMEQWDRDGELRDALAELAKWINEAGRWRTKYEEATKVPSIPHDKELEYLLLLLADLPVGETGPWSLRLHDLVQRLRARVVELERQVKAYA